MKSELHNTLCLHCLSNLQEACDVCTCNQVALAAVFLGSACNVVVNVNHDMMQLVVNLLEGPGQTLGVLAHLQSGGSYAACVCSLCRSEQNVAALEYSDSFRSRRHVCAFADNLYAVSNQCLCVLFVDFVLGSARQSDVALNSPDALALEVLCRRNCLNVLLDAAAANFLDFLDNVQVDAVLVNNVAVGVGQRDNLCAQLGSLLGSVDCYVAGTGDNNLLALEGSTCLLYTSPSPRDAHESRMPSSA